MKKCIKCKIEKELIEFTNRKDSKDGFYNECRLCQKEYDKKHYKANKEKRKEQMKEYNKVNKEIIQEYKKEYYESNKKFLTEYAKEYYKANKEKMKEYSEANKGRKNKLAIERKKVDPLFKLSSNLRTRTWYAFKRKGYNKNTKTQEMLGVDWEVCKSHIERQFTKGMSWDNSGDWHIDHIIPLSSANTEEELKKLCHYSNLQPLWAVDNLMKSAKINGQQNKFRF
mgnify:CR=1 FL=1